MYACLCREANYILHSQGWPSLVKLNSQKQTQEEEKEEKEEEEIKFTQVSLIFF